MFYGDSALHGNVSAPICAYNFFGAKYILFGTDMPFDAKISLWSIQKAIESVEHNDGNQGENQSTELCIMLS